MPASCIWANWQGERYGVVIAHESHNHPSQVVPFEGAATGIGGIVRDVLCMGAEVIAIADPLRFGRLDDPHCRYVAQGVVDGIAAYGNAIGVPNIGGDVYIDESLRRQRAGQRRRAGAGEASRDHPLESAGGFAGLGHRAGRKSDRPQRLRRRVVLVGHARRSRCGSKQGRGASPRSVPEERDHARVISRVRRVCGGAGIDRRFQGSWARAGCRAAARSSSPPAASAPRSISTARRPRSPNLPAAVIAIGETQERLCWIVPPAFTPELLRIYNETFSLPRSRAAPAPPSSATVTETGRYVATPPRRAW